MELTSRQIYRLAKAESLIENVLRLYKTHGQKTAIAWLSVAEDYCREIRDEIEIEETKESIANKGETIMLKSEAEKESTASIILKDFEATALRATRIAEEVAQKLSSVSFPDNLVKQEECEVTRRYPALFESFRDNKIKIDDALLKIESIMKRCEL